MTDIQGLYSKPAILEPAKDRLEYVADLIAELEMLAAAEPGCDTLRGLLSLAEREARRVAGCGAA